MTDSEIHADYGPIAGVWIGGNLDNGAEVLASQGNVGPVHIGGNLDHAAIVRSGTGISGLSAVSIGGNFSNGADIEADGGAVASVTVAGSSLGASGSLARVFGATGVGAIDIGGASDYADFESGGSLGSIYVGGAMQNGSVSCNNGGGIASVTVGDLDGTTIDTRGTTAPRPRASGRTSRRQTARSGR